jgi:hypothetical protein
MALTGKTIGQLTYLSGVTTDTLFPVELSGDTYHIAYSAFTNSNYNEGTYDELYSFATGETLTAGSYYLMTDYQSCYDQPNYDNTKNPITTGNYKTGTTEPILLLAISTTGFSPTIYSTLHPQDKISYDITWNITEVTGGPAKGRITERIDNLNNRTDYDHRTILFKRYRGYSYYENNPLSGLVGISGLTGSTGVLYGNTGTTFTSDFSIGSVVSVQNSNPSFFDVISVVSDSLMIISGETISVTTDSLYYSASDDGIMSYYQPNIRNQVYEYTTFGDAIDNETAINNYVGNQANLYLNWGVGDFLLANNVFISGEYINNTIGNGSYNNTFNDDCDSNQIGDSFYNNSTNDDFDGNIIGDYFNNNYITANFNYNRIGSYFYSNILIGGSFYRNNIGNDFRENVWTNNDFQNNEIGNQFNNNNIYDDFYNNDIGNGYNGNESYSEFYRNLIGNGYSGNTIYSNFYENNIGFNFYNNTIGTNLTIGTYNFRGNIINNIFENNTILDSFNDNTIGNEFKGNLMLGEFELNDIGSFIGGNQFSGGTYNNKFGSYTFDNDFLGGVFNNSCMTGFNNNTIGENFSANNIGFNFGSNVIGENFGYGASAPQGNIIGNNFYNNNIGEYFYDNSIPDNFVYNTIDNYFQWNIVNTAVSGVCLSTGILYDVTTVNVFKNKNGDNRLSYYDESDVLTIETLTEAPCLGGLNALDIPENDLNFGLMLSPTFTITSSDFATGNPIYQDTIALGGYGTDGFTNTASQGDLYQGYIGGGLHGNSLSGLTTAYNALGFSLSNYTGHLWYVTWGSGSSINKGIVKFGSNVNGASFDIQTIDTTDPTYLGNNGSGTSLVGTFLFPATFTIYYPLTNKTGWC